MQCRSRNRRIFHDRVRCISKRSYSFVRTRDGGMFLPLCYPSPEKTCARALPASLLSPRTAILSRRIPLRLVAFSLSLSLCSAPRDSIAEFGRPGPSCSAPNAITFVYRARAHAHAHLVRFGSSHCVLPCNAYDCPTGPSLLLFVCFFRVSVQIHVLASADENPSVASSTVQIMRSAPRTDVRRTESPRQFVFFFAFRESSRIVSPMAR